MIRNLRNRLALWILHDLTLEYHIRPAQIRWYLIGEKQRFPNRPHPKIKIYPIYESNRTLWKNEIDWLHKTIGEE